MSHQMYVTIVVKLHGHSSFLAGTLIVAGFLFQKIVAMCLSLSLLLEG